MIKYIKFTFIVIFLAFIVFSVFNSKQDEDTTIEKKLDENTQSNLNELEVSDEHRVFDYVFFCFFLGNDFLPHFPALNIRTNGFDVFSDPFSKSTV